MRAAQDHDSVEAVCTTLATNFLQKYEPADVQVEHELVRTGNVLKEDYVNKKHANKEFYDQLRIFMKAVEKAEHDAMTAAVDKNTDTHLFDSDSANSDALQFHRLLRRGLQLAHNKDKSVHVPQEVKNNSSTKRKLPGGGRTKGSFMVVLEGYRKKAVSDA